VVRAKYIVRNAFVVPVTVAALCLALSATVAVAAGALGVSAASARTANRKVPAAHISVVGGEIAEPGAFPWMAFVFDAKGEEAIACSGTVVAPNLVLTAAHCAVNLETGVINEAAGYRVVTGSVDWAASSERQVSSVSQVLVYPRFKVGRNSSGYGDAALLVLSTPTTAPAIHLATSVEAKRVHMGTHALIAGWGETYYGQAELTEWLMWARTVVEGNRCEGLRGRICAIDFPKFKSGVCHGDSGGPLLTSASHGQGLIEIGITQAVFGRCSTRRPGVFTRADLISPWVDRWISTLDPPS
jgi:secreted trypsin-like serine protease